jgi:hypothetical protein
MTDALKAAAVAAEATIVLSTAAICVGLPAGQSGAARCRLYTLGPAFRGRAVNRSGR